MTSLFAKQAHYTKRYGSMAVMPVCLWVRNLVFGRN